MTLNIRYDLPETIWEKITSVYEQLPGWVGFSDGIPFWFGLDENDKHVWASVEPSGLHVSGYMDKNEWLQWITSFKEIYFALIYYSGLVPAGRLS